MAPLPLHGQVRPIKVEQVEPEGWHHSSMEVNDEHHPSNLSSTPPILRRRGRKRDADEERLDQVTSILCLLWGRSNFGKQEWRIDSNLVYSPFKSTPVKELPFSPSEVEHCKVSNMLVSFCAFLRFLAFPLVHNICSTLPLCT